MQRRTAAIMSLGVSALVLAGLYVAFQRSPDRAADDLALDAKHGAASSPSPAATVAPPPSAAPPPVASVTPAPDPTPPAPLRIAVENVKPGVVVPDLQAKQGDAVTIIVTTDQPGTLEIHGYSQSVAVTPGTEAKLAFRAEHAGRFPIHLHTRSGAHVEVTAFEVQPK